MGGIWFCGVNLFTNILIIVSVELLIKTKYHTWLNAIVLIVITFISYIFFLIIVQNLTMFNSVGTIGEAFSSGKMWMDIIFIGGTCGIIDFFILSVEFIFFPSLTKTLQVLVNKKIDLNEINNKNLPKIVKEKLEFYNEFNSGEEEEVVIKENKKNEEENLINNKKEISKIKIENDQSDEGNINNINNINKNIIIKKKNSLKINEKNNNEHKIKKIIITDDITTNANKNNNKNNNDIKTDLFLIKKQNNIEIEKEKEEGSVSKDALIKGDLDDNKNTNIIK